MANTESENVKPNIVFILTDQMRGDCLGVSGHPVVETPNLDMLARKGVNFTAAYSSCPSCIAARASIFTGLHPTTHGRIGYQNQVPWTYQDTLAQLLGDAGYQTHCCGKTHFYPQRLGLGFQSLDSYEGKQNFSGKYVNDYFEWLDEKSAGKYKETDHGVDSNSWYARPSHLPEELHLNTWTTSCGINFVRRRDVTRPFFLNISYHRPHPPLDPPSIFFDMYKDQELPDVPVGDWAEKYDDFPDNINSWYGKLPKKTLDRARKAYYAQISHIDNQIGRFIMELRGLCKEPTWFIFTADHGEMLGDHNMFRKTYAYEGSAKVPFIICPPEKVQIDSCQTPCVLEDVMPTILSMAGVDVPDAVEGKNLLPLLENNNSQSFDREYIHGEHSACYSKDLAMQYLTDGKEKYIWYTLSGEEQFFDLQNDPCELKNLAENPEYKERIELWRSRMVEKLKNRKEDGLSDGKNLISGKILPAVRFNE